MTEQDIANHVANTLLGGHVIRFENPIVVAGGNTLNVAFEDDRDKITRVPVPRAGVVVGIRLGPKTHTLVYKDD